MNPFEVMLKSKAYGLVESYKGADLIDAAGDEIPLQLEQVCFKCTPQLKTAAYDMADLLGISKRRFLELATMYAIERAEQELNEAGVYELAYDRHYQENR